MLASGANLVSHLASGMVVVSTLSSHVWWERRKAPDAHALSPRLQNIIELEFLLLLDVVSPS